MKGENTLRGRHPYFFAIKALQRNLLQNVTKMKGENTLKGRHSYFLPFCYLQRNLLQKR